MNASHVSLSAGATAVKRPVGPDPAYCDVVHGNSTSLLGWIVIVSKRHLAAIDELDDDEANDLGMLIRDVSRCEKTYVMQFAEAEGHNHVHFHVVAVRPTCRQNT